jgi:hypothetical protein
VAWNNPSTWLAGAVLTAAQLNAQLRDNLLAIGDPWPSYTPTFTGLSVSNGTLAARARVAGKDIRWSVSLTFGSTTAVTGNITVTLPVAARLRFAGTSFGDVTLWDSSANAFRIWHATHDLSSNGTRVFLTDDSGNVAAGANPWTWATGDRIEINGGYEAN